MRFVIAKNSESPEITTQSTPTPSPRAYPSRVPSISATPPPFAVELTLTTRRSPRRSRSSAAAARSAARRSLPMIGSMRRGSSGTTFTESPADMSRSLADRRSTTRDLLPFPVEPRPKRHMRATPTDGFVPAVERAGHTYVVAVESLDFDALIGAWRRAFEAARLALQAARHELPPAELGTRARRLADERVATARLLESFAQERQMKRFLVRLVASSWEAKRVLGLPADAVACVFNVDGVLVPSAAIHAEAWKMTFDEFNGRRIERTGVSLAAFSVDVDYPRLIHGRSTIASVHEYLASRGITLPDGVGTTRPAARRSTGSPAARTALSSRCSLGAAPIPSRARVCTSSSCAMRRCAAPSCPVPRICTCCSNGLASRV